MGVITVKQVTLGQGKPKICVPIVAKTIEEIREQAGQLQGLTYDLVEWRADWYEALGIEGGISAGLTALREQLPEIPVIFTIRTRSEGGEVALLGADYAAYNRAALEAGADLIDVEFSSGAEILQELIRAAHEKGRWVIGSSHDFEKTPDAFELETRLKAMEAAGCDIAKIAVMPKEREDVLILLGVTERMSRRLSCPLITMSMGGDGVISRLCGEVFGSCLTFGTAGRASAPGQVETEKLARVLELLHKSM